MIKKNIIFQYLFLLVLIFILSIEKIKLSWEISTLYNNSENIKVELEKLKDPFNKGGISSVDTEKISQIQKRHMER